MATEKRPRRGPPSGVRQSGHDLAGERITPVDQQFGRRESADPTSGNTTLNADLSSGDEFMHGDAASSRDKSELTGGARGTEEITMKASYAGEQQTGTSNQDYDLVSVLYHSLQGAETCAQYIKDAEQGGDQNLVEFFREVMAQDRQTAQRAMHLLAERASRGAQQFKGGETGAGAEATRH
ncbi:MAG: hypothetical protein AB2A00_38810 [Myxococcota bacterium]